jgi:hypothetical protein
MLFLRRPLFLPDGGRCRHSAPRAAAVGSRRLWTTPDHAQSALIRPARGERYLTTEEFGYIRPFNITINGVAVARTARWSST